MDGMAVNVGSSTADERALSIQRKPGESEGHSGDRGRVGKGRPCGEWVTGGPVGSGGEAAWRWAWWACELLLGTQAKEAAPPSRVPGGSAEAWGQGTVGEERPQRHSAPAAPALTFQVMAFLLRKKSSLLTHRVLQLILAVAGTAELGFGPSARTNIGVFQHVLCDFEVNGDGGEPAGECEGGACRGV